MNVLLNSGIAKCTCMSIYNMLNHWKINVTYAIHPEICLDLFVAGGTMSKGSRE